jgi:hypothetical protein
VHHQAVDDGPPVEATPVICACSEVRNGRGFTSVEQIEPLPESLWRASCWHCGWYQDEHYPEDAEGEADAHECPACAVCGHQGPARGLGEHTAP